ncbi:hypothetical protein K3727_18835 [Rhodobacteraceae bacterium M382]|nr:hypothetical protein K3727_18835 [Rhodobacteraceae bacterium M382]
MKSNSTNTKTQAIRKLIEAFASVRPDVPINASGYAGAFRDNLLSQVSPDDFELDLRAGDGNELGTKFRAAHSSSALAVNSFAPFRSRIADLRLCEQSHFTDLQFERKCPTGLRGGRAPNLDVLLTSESTVIGIESKLTEYLGPHIATFSAAYTNQIRDERREQGYFREMQRLMNAPNHYKWLDAAQLIKHGFGLAKTFTGKAVSLCYLYWEPADPESSPAFAEHRAEIVEFADRVAGSTPFFFATSYPELWSSWRAEAPPWISRHIDELEARYLVTL